MGYQDNLNGKAVANCWSLDGKTTKSADEEEAEWTGESFIISLAIICFQIFSAGDI